MTFVAATQAMNRYSKAPSNVCKTTLLLPNDNPLLFCSYNASCRYKSGR